MDSTGCHFVLTGARRLNSNQLSTTLGNVIWRECRAGNHAETLSCLSLDSYLSLPLLLSSMD